MLPGCSSASDSSVDSSESVLSAADITNSESSGNPTEEGQQEGPATYPTGWLAVQIGDVQPGTSLQILWAPGFDIVGHRDGAPITADEQARLQSEWPVVGEGEAIVQQDDHIAVVPADALLVNLPDVLPQAEYDIVYSYASTSRCAGQDIPGVTGERLPGYADGMQDDPYWNDARFAVPCAYQTALKAQTVCDVLANSGYRLLVFDAYRPMTAQLYLSDCFERAFWESPEMQESLGDWTLTWYVANGASGHNFGTDLDVGVCDADGTPLSMPSSFDAFDESGHLTAWPINAWDITPSDYCDAVAGNAACLALHEAFTQAGFSELASEWWHFADDKTEAAMRSLVGDGGLDFTA